MTELLLGVALGFVAGAVEPVRTRVVGFAKRAWEYLRDAYNPPPKE